MAKKTPTDNPRPAKTLRERAEELLKTSHADIAAMSNEDVRRLVHELQVHQMELEIQNEDLREAQIELAHSRDRYSDLYEFAPVGYLTLDRQGLIQEANLTAATMLGVERKRLTNRKLTDFLSDEAQDAWHLHRREVFSDEAKKSCELAMNPAHGNSLTVRLESLVFRDEDGNLSQCRTALIDVTTVKQARQQLEQSEQRYQRLTDAVIDYVFTVRIENGGETETTHGLNCESVTGYTPDDFAANKLLWISIVPPVWPSAMSITSVCLPASSAILVNASSFSATFCRSPKTNNAGLARICTIARNRNWRVWECWRRHSATNCRKTLTIGQRSGRPTFACWRQKLLTASGERIEKCRRYPEDWFPLVSTPRD
ncbi:MAG: PAS domain S-box protein [Betaproteobacteria bacterium]